MQGSYMSLATERNPQIFESMKLTPSKASPTPMPAKIPMKLPKLDQQPCATKHVASNMLPQAWKCICRRALRSWDGLGWALQLLEGKGEPGQAA